ncbi:MAG: pilin [Candidatus Paceibacterota bacterium]|jgi:hypothetical protein
MVNKLKFLFLSLSVIIGCFLYEEALASIEIDVPSNASLNQPVEISATANLGQDENGEDITINRLIITIRVGSDVFYSNDKLFCSPDIITCSKDVTVTPTEEGVYLGEVTAVPFNMAILSQKETFSFTVGSGSPPPSDEEGAPDITNIEPSTISRGRTFTITGENLCYQKVFDLGVIVILSQEGKTETINKSYLSNDECTEVLVICPEDLSLEEGLVDVSVLNKIGASSPVSILLSGEPPPDPSEVNVYSKADLLLEWPDSPGGTSLEDDSSLPELIQYIYEWGISLGGLAVFVSLIVAGIQYISSFGDPVSMKNAMERIRSAFIGLVVLLSSWLVLNTINPDLTTFYAINESVSSSNLGSCGTDDSKCREGEVCYKGFCTTDFEKLSGTSCDSVLIQGTGDYSEEEGCQNITTIEENRSITFIARPELYVEHEDESEDMGCLGYIELYPDNGCNGDKQTMIFNGRSNIYKSTTADRIRSVKFVGFEDQSF